MGLKEKIDAKENEINDLKLSNGRLVKEIKEKLELEESSLETHNYEIHQFEDKIEKLEVRITELLKDLGKKDDDLKILKYKERQAVDYEVKIDETKKMLEDNRKETLALKEYERKLTRKITDLEFDLYTKTAESETQSLVILRLNEKIQSLQHQDVKSQDYEDLDFSGTRLYAEVLDSGLVPNYDDATTAADDDSVSNDDRSLMKGSPQTSPYVVSTPGRKRKLKDISNIDSDDELDYSNEASEVPEFESLCAEIETLCVPSKRPLPFPASSSPDKKMRMSDDILDIDTDIPNDGQEAEESSAWIGSFIIGILIESIFES